MTRSDATQLILERKRQKGLSFEAIAKAVGRHKVWVTAALLGQATMSAEEAQKAVTVLGLGPDIAADLPKRPIRGAYHENRARCLAGHWRSAGRWRLTGRWRRDKRRP